LRTHLRALAFFSSLLCAAVAGAQEAPAPADAGRAIDALGRQGGREAVREIEARIEQGLTPPLLSRAIAALVRIGDRHAATVLLELAQHRRATIRASVAEALGRLGDQRARPVLADLLDDPDPRVRAAAANALGTVGAREVMSTLILAAVRGVSEAAIVVGQQAGAPDIARLLNRVDVRTLPSLAPTLRVLLGRENVPLRSKQAIVSTLGRIPGAETERLLREVEASLSPGDPLHRNVGEALSAITETQEASEEPAE
jgi:HEAT repeat protein